AAAQAAARPKRVGAACPENIDREAVPLRPGRTGRVRVLARPPEESEGRRAAGRGPPVSKDCLSRDHPVDAEQLLGIGPDFFGSEAGPFSQFLEFGVRVLA